MQGKGLKPRREGRPPSLSIRHFESHLGLIRPHPARHRHITSNSPSWAPRSSLTSRSMRRVTQPVLVNKLQPADRHQHLVPNVINRQYYQILRKARFYLRIQPDYSPDFDVGDEQDADGSHARFCRVFRETWLSPKLTGYRRGMLEFWRGPALAVPTIALESDYPILGAYMTIGRDFAFNSGGVRLVDQDGFLPDLIAHELAHAWHHTRPNSFITTSPGATDQIEKEANDLAKTWRYRMEELESWWNAHLPQLQACGINILPGQKF